MGSLQIKGKNLCQIRYFSSKNFLFHEKFCNFALAKVI